MTNTITVKGLNATIRKLERVESGIGGPGLVPPMKKATSIVTGSARQNAPVDTGRLRASIMPAVKTLWNSVQGIVGSSVKYAPFMELGTRPHFPPISALRVWARRHGMNAYTVVRAIGRRGLAARRFLARALESNVKNINKAFEDHVKRLTK